MKARDLVRHLPSYQCYGLPPGDMRLWPSYALGLFTFVIALSLRWLLDEDLPAGYPFLTFFPAVIFTAFLAGLWPGILVSVLGYFASWYFFIPPVFSFALTGNSAIALLFYLFIVTVDLVVINLAFSALVESDAANRKNSEMNEFQTLLIRELDHRIKNLFSVVAAVVKLSARGADSPRQVAEEASARIMALSRSHSSLWQVGEGQSTTVATVARQILEPYLADHAARIRIDAESQPLDVRQVQIMSLMFHELATNSAKYGALAGTLGEVSISAGRSHDDNKAQLAVRWLETGIKCQRDQDHEGFGSELISRLVMGAGGTFERVIAGNQLRATALLPF